MKEPTFALDEEGYIPLETHVLVIFTFRGSNPTTLTSFVLVITESIKPSITISFPMDPPSHVTLLLVRSIKPVAFRTARIPYTRLSGINFFNSEIETSRFLIKRSITVLANSKVRKLVTSTFLIFMDKKRKGLRHG